jgi:hypothetical protein
LPVAEFPRCLDERSPRRLVAGPVLDKAAGLLKLPDGGLGGGAEYARLGSGRGQIR